MTARFEFAVTQEATELKLRGADGPIPVERWPAETPADLRLGVDLAQRLEAADNANPDGATLRIEHAAIAGLTVHEASLLGLPPAADAVAAIATRGIVTQPGFEVTLRWQRAMGQAILRATRIGAWLAIGEQWRRLPDPLFSFAEAVEAAQRAGNDAGARLTALAGLLALLPEVQKQGAAHAKGMLGQISIHVADAFSLALDGEGENTRLVPVLHRAGGDPEAPLLPEPLHQAFARQQFNGFSEARTVYALPNSNMLVLSPPLRRALSVVRRIQSAAPATRRALFANPRLYLREALGDEDETLIENVFRETHAYSDRVIGLGLWQPRVVPWIQVATTDWFAGAETVGPAGPPLAAGLWVGDTRVELTPAEAHELRDRLEQAIASGQTSVELARPDGPPIAISVSHEVLTALGRIEQLRPPSRSGDGPVERAPVEVLLIRPNEDTLEIEAAVSPRAEMPAETPMALATAPKQHQRDGLAWLQSAWTEGVAGVLLADDMGLGKTLQGLAFLAWLRGGMEAGILPREPVLIVAPTGLLANWQKEHLTHLSAPGLGTCVLAYGQTLRLLRRRANGQPGLDVAALGRAAWVLTTYETLRDYDRDFGQVQFAAAIFDEAQKIKNSGYPAL